MKRVFCIILTCLISNVIVAVADENIEQYKPIATKIIQMAHADSNAWERMAKMCDSFGPRLVGSESLEKAIDWCYEKMQQDDLENVKKEKVNIYQWVRGNEYCHLVEPWKSDIPCLTLGGSVATPKNGITAEVVCIGSKEELETKKDEIKGKIVLFDESFINYGHNVQYRVYGADWASKYGAVASMIRPCTDNSFQNAHTGVMRYKDSTVKKIPHFSITGQGTELIHRLCERGQKVVVTLYAEAHENGMGVSYNVMGELKGTLLKDEVVAVGGHIDSWDAGIGSGAHDDGGPSIVAWEAVKLLQQLGLKPKRTIRAVLWVDEEYRQTGGKAYAEAHGKENHFGLLEFDSGCFAPKGLGYTGPDSLFMRLQQYEPILKMVTDTFTITKGGGGVDIRPMGELGYPTMGWRTMNDDYFTYHHSPLDTPEAVDPKDMNDNIAAMAILLYIYANM